MEIIYPFFIAFSMVFVSELGDKTQLLVLSFSGKGRTFKILLGVAIGSLFSHGLAILFGSSINLLADQMLHNIIEVITYSSFLLMGFLTLLPKKEKALSIMVGELGDKTFLASIGLGVQYPNSKIPLILGAICAMVACDFIAILFGKLLNKYISEKSMQKLSGILFLLFGIIGIAGMIGIF